LDSVCAFASGINYSITPVAGITVYEWSVPAGATIVSGQGTTAIVVNFGNSSGNIGVSSDSSGCLSTPRQLAIIVAAPVSVSFSLLQDTVCFFTPPITLNTGLPA